MTKGSEPPPEMLAELSCLRRQVEELHLTVQEHARAAEQLDDIFNLSLDLLVVAGLDGYYKRVNPAFSRLLGFTEQELLGRPFIEFIYPDDHEEAGQKMAMLLAGAEVIDFEDRNLHKDGSVRWISWVVKPRVEQGLVYGVGRDITERKQAEQQRLRAHEDLEERVAERTERLQRANEELARENRERRQAVEALRQSEERFRSLAEAMDDVVWTAQVPAGDALIDSRVLFISPSAVQVTGYPPEHFIGHTDRWVRLVHPQDRPEFDQRLSVMGQQGRLVHEYRILHRDGQERWVHDHTWVVDRDEDGGLRLGGLVRDITEQRLAEMALRQSEERFRSLAEAMDDVVWTGRMDPGVPTTISRFYYLNPVVERVTGYPPEAFYQRPKLLEELAHPGHPDELPQQVQNFARTGRTAWEHRIIRADGTERWVFARAWAMAQDDQVGVRVGGLLRDITEQRHTAEVLREKDLQLQQAQKLEAVGLLAGGVAHEFNNILQVIQGYTHLAMQGVAEDSPRHEHMLRVFKAVDRAASLTEQLLSFSRRQPLRKHYIDPQKLLSEHLKMIKPLIGVQYQVETHIGSAGGTVYVDAGQLQQVLLNLTLNARDAMPAGGRLSFRLDQVQVAAEGKLASLGLSPGAHLMLAVEDTGKGMSPDVQAKAFEPFFTTKEVGQGTGLGLATVYGIVKQHDGAVDLQSAPGKGTTIFVYLPIHERHSESSTSHMAVPGGGSEGILVAEDEPMILDLAVSVLRNAGYKTFEAGDGLEAIRVFQQHREEISLALLDVIMPRVSGRGVLGQLRLMQPDLPAVFCSGHDPKNTEVGVLLREGHSLLHKPFSPMTLLAAVREVLDSRR